MANRRVDEEDEQISKSELKRIDSVPKKFTVLDYIKPLMEKNLPKNESRLIRHIANYYNRNVDKLETLYMVSYPIWTQADQDILFECTGIDQDTMEEIVQNIEQPEYYQIHKYYITAVPILILFIIRYFWEKKNEKNAQMMYYYLAYSMYWMAYTRSLPMKNYDMKKEVIVYTVNNLSSKFKLKQLGSINKWLYYMMNQIMTTYERLIVSGSDYEMMTVVDAARTKIGNSFKTIANQIITNAKNKNAIMMSKTMDEEGEMLPTNSQSEEIDSLATKYTTQFFTLGVSEKICTLSAKQADVNKNEIRATISALKDSDDNFQDVKEFYGAVFSIFLSSGRYTAKDIKSTAFVAVTNNIYKKGNTANEHLLKIREILSKWLMAGSPLYRAVSRTATQSEYRKAIYFYMTYSVATES